MTVQLALYIIDICNSFRSAIPALLAASGTVIALWFLFSSFCVDDQIEWSDTKIHKYRKQLLIYPIVLIMFLFFPSENTVYTYIEHKVASSLYAGGDCVEKVSVNGNEYVV